MTKKEKIKYASGSEYIGEIKNDLPHGKGSYHWYNGVTYVGSWKKGKKHGKGVDSLPYDKVNDCSEKYVGEFKNDKRNGRGTFYLYDKKGIVEEKYIGEWKNNKPHGKGTLSFFKKLQQKYRGDFKNGNRHGRGILTNIHGDKLEGVWKDDVAYKAIKYTFVSGEIKCTYFGGLTKNKEQLKSRDYLPNGKGKLETQGVDGAMDIYVGEFKNGKSHGKGILTENVGGQYEGYQKNLKHIGIWKNGKSIKGKSIYQDGTKYEGDWIDENLAQGYGKITYPDGSKFVGKFYYDDPVKGEGVIHFSDSKYVGEMRTKDGSLDSHGEGIMTYKNGDKLIGNWKDGMPIKAHKYTFSYNKEMKFEYKGGLKKGAFHGKGIIKTIRTSVPKYLYEKGTFLNNLLEGRGIKIYYDDKNFSRSVYIYKGEFKKGKRHGHGLEWVFPDKHFIEGLFKNNNFQGSKKNPLTKKVFKIILDANDLNK